MDGILWMVLWNIISLSGVNNSTAIRRKDRWPVLELRGSQRAACILGRLTMTVPGTREWKGKWKLVFKEKNRSDNPRAGSESLLSHQTMILE